MGSEPLALFMVGVGVQSHLPMDSRRVLRSSTCLSCRRRGGQPAVSRPYVADEPEHFSSRRELPCSSEPIESVFFLQRTGLTDLGILAFVAGDDHCGGRLTAGLYRGWYGAITSPNRICYWEDKASVSRSTV